MNTVYLARAIDAGTERVTEGIEKVVSEMLTAMGHIVYRPGQAWAAPTVPEPSHAVALCAVNEAARMASDLVLAIVSNSMRSIGVPAEVGASLSEGKRVAFIDVSDDDTLTRSYVLTAWVSSCPVFKWRGSSAGQLRAFLEEVAKWPSC